MLTAVPFIFSGKEDPAVPSQEDPPRGVYKRRDPVPKKSIPDFGYSQGMEPDETDPGKRSFHPGYHVFKTTAWVIINPRFF